MVLAGHPTREAPAQTVHAIFQQVHLRCSITCVYTSNIRCTACSLCLLLSSHLLGHIAADSTCLGIVSRHVEKPCWNMACYVVSQAQHGTAQHGTPYIAQHTIAWHDPNMLVGCRVACSRHPPRANWGREGQAATQPPLLAWSPVRLTPIPTPMATPQCKVGRRAWSPPPTPTPSRQVLLGTPSLLVRPPHRYHPCFIHQPMLALHSCISMPMPPSLLLLILPCCFATMPRVSAY